MANKGPRMRIDIPALEAIIVAANRFKQVCDEKATSIRQTCLKMESEESLTGGEGDTIRQSFQAISTGISNVEKSVDFAVTTLNSSLEKAIGMQKGRMAGDLQDKSQSAAGKAGVLRKN